MVPSFLEGMQSGGERSPSIFFMSNFKKILAAFFLNLVKSMKLQIYKAQ